MQNGQFLIGKSGFLPVDLRAVQKYSYVNIDGEKKKTIGQITSYYGAEIQYNKIKGYYAYVSVYSDMSLSNTLHFEFHTYQQYGSVIIIDDDNILLTKSSSEWSKIGEGHYECTCGVAGPFKDPYVICNIGTE